MALQDATKRKLFNELLAELTIIQNLTKETLENTYDQMSLKEVKEELLGVRADKKRMIEAINIINVQKEENNEATDPKETSK